MAGDLAILRIAVAHAYQPTRILGLVDVGAMDRIDAEYNYIAGIGRNGHGIFEVEFVSGQVRRARGRPRSL